MPLKSTPVFTTRPLSDQTWSAYSALIERNGGIWGGCWCMEFHPEGAQRGPQRREQKECRVRDGCAHASLVFDGESCVGWCQYGPTEELTRIKHLRAYQQGVTTLPDWRITCFFVDKPYRGQGAAEIALKGALQAIAEAGGGLVESYPELTADRKVSSSFLYNANLAMFERNGFVRDRQIGKNHWVMARTVEAKASA